ncbi:cupin domain-containing protein [Paenibacillus sp. GCM10023248]|uniref:cupin domain-containing protein n=1 Tax=unclassified Paenibacillus TaxID=185978 RepID=UPI002379DE70|nr:cupin domain-containing protein [Paenibacillus sp. MAHUQ-63]MDD9268404.1 cupin domain-containing protein [Paenibacillus sp. MAHUQ-63]
MKMLRLCDLQDIQSGHILQDVLPGANLSSGGLAFAKQGERSHTNDGPDGRDYHIHGDCEAFLILQGSGTMEVDGVFHRVRVGDVVIIEPGEDHHLLSSEDDPIVTVWCHAGPSRHKDQQDKGPV